jgi:rod shape determining protein RodA
MTYGYPTTVKRPAGTGVVSRIVGGSSYLRRLDWILLLAAVALSIIGAFCIWSATRTKLESFGNDPQTFFKRHLINLAIGLVLGFLFSRIDYRLLRAYAPVLFGLSVLGLIVVLSPIGSTVNGTKAWIELPAGFSIQPAEFTKLGLILVVASLLSERRDGENEPNTRDILQVLAIFAVPAALVLIQPDLGTALIMGVAVFGMIAVSGAKTRLVVGLLLSVIVVAFGAVQLGVLKPYQVQRLTAFADPSGGGSTYGYNTQQARIAIGSGGLTGEGLFHGAQTQRHFVPYNQTDFVYSVAGEELGFVGGAGIILLFGVVLWRGIRIASRATDMFGRLVAVGILCWLSFQAFENIGMNLGIMPVTGVPLPFLSYGGTSMFASWIAIGLLQNVHLRSQD